VNCLPILVSTRRSWNPSKRNEGAGVTQQDVTAVLRKQAGHLLLIILVLASYNTGFGGDLLSGSAKSWI